MLVTVEAGVSPTRDVFVRVALGPGGYERGALRGDSDGGTCMRLGAAAWRSTARAGEFATLVLNRPGADASVA
jgi:hypothetical protein